MNSGWGQAAMKSQAEDRSTPMMCDAFEMRCFDPVGVASGRTVLTPTPYRDRQKK
tara:strand:+ start:935 stop:1099 length:165 start_codon:yes stop_codon:yes gene_type:complete